MRVNNATISTRHTDDTYNGFSLKIYLRMNDYQDQFMLSGRAQLPKHWATNRAKFLSNKSIKIHLMRAPNVSVTHVMPQ